MQIWLSFGSDILLSFYLCQTVGFTTDLNEMKFKYLNIPFSGASGALVPHTYLRPEARPVAQTFPPQL